MRVPNQLSGLLMGVERGKRVLMDKMDVMDVSINPKKSDKKGLLQGIREVARTLILGFVVRRSIQLSYGRI